MGRRAGSKNKSKFYSVKLSDLNSVLEEDCEVEVSFKYKILIEKTLRPEGLLSNLSSVCSSQNINDKVARRVREKKENSLKFEVIIP